MTAWQTGILTFWAACKELCFPPVCLACGAGLPPPPVRVGIHFCRTCAAEIKLLAEPLCRCCGKPFPYAAGGRHFCGSCLQAPGHITAARAIALYQGPLATAIHAFKYHGKTTGLSTFAAFKQRQALVDDLRVPDLIVPVPLHARRLRARGFNQALLLARIFFPGQGKKIAPTLLERRQWTPPQTGLSGKARRQNVKGAFGVKNPARLTGQRVLLIDDVLTTGATVEECARVLCRAGAQEVQVLTLARVRD